MLVRFCLRSGIGLRILVRVRFAGVQRVVLIVRFVRGVGPRCELLRRERIVHVEEAIFDCDDFERSSSGNGG
jgi:hypothetical protein